MAWQLSSEAPVDTKLWGHLGKPIFRLVMCIAAVFAVTAVIYAIPLRDRALTAALAFLFVVLIVSAAWGFRYALFVSLLAALGFSWLLPPVGRFWLNDSRDVFVLAAFLTIGITSRFSNRARIALQRSESYLADAQRLTKTGSWAYNPFTGKTIYWSDEMFRIFGLNPQEGPSSEKFWQLVHPEDHDRVRKRVEREAHEKTEYVDDYRIVLPNGTAKHILDIGHPVFNGTGDVIEFVFTTVDVTERKRAVETLRRSEAYLAEAQRLTHAGSWAWAPATDKAVYWSQECTKSLEGAACGPRPTRVEAQHFTSLYPPVLSRLKCCLKELDPRRGRFQAS